MRTRKDPEARQQEIIQTAVKLLSDRPYQKVSMTEIAKTIGISKAAIYFYYPNKEALLKEVILYSLSEPLEALKNAEAKESNLEQKISEMLVSSLTLALFKPKQLSRLINSNGDYALDVKRHHTKKSLELYRKVLSKAEQDGLIRLEKVDLTPLDASKLLLSGAFGVAQGTRVGSPILPKNQMVKAITSFVTAILKGWAT